MAYYVKAKWDDDAQVWVSDSNIPGLVIETSTLAEFETLMNQLAPEMLAANADIHDSSVPVQFEASATRDLLVA
ncbi:MAG: DUF1902 domain-containing protein [Brevundimonas sp.]|nr:MAG: DUF1902 domain-containing protein [Brevundimonas sp.]